MDIRTDLTGRGLGGAAAAGRRSPLALRILLPVLALALAAGVMAFLAATAKKPEKKTEAPLAIAVEIAPVKAVRANLQVTSQGEVKSKTEAEVAARVGGQIVYVAPSFEPGAAVKTGQTLARIDPAEYRLAVERAHSQVSRARENLARMRSEAALAREDWEELGLESAPSDLTLLKPQLASATADLRTAEAAVREAELALERTDIRAPFDGRVKTRRVDVGDFVAPGSPIASLFAVDVAQVRVPLSDQELGVLGVAPGFTASTDDPGPAATIRGAGAQGDRVWSGNLALVEASFEPTTRLVYGLVEVKEPFAGAVPLAPGLYVSVELKGRREENLFAVPRGAYKKNEVVYTVDASGAIKGHRLQAAHATATEVFFRSGLSADQRVVVSYLPSPRDGMKVRDRSAPAPKAEEPAKDKSGEKTKQAKAEPKGD